MLKELISNDLINFKYCEDNLESLFKIVAKDLLDKDLVQPTYFEALVQREKEYPTGLATQYLNIGLPHTDPDHIKEPFVYIVKNDKKLKHKQMGDNSDMESQYFFFLGIKKPSDQVGLLSELMDVFMNEDFVIWFKDSNEEEIKNNIYKKI
ncbi:PTS sugar transporter subunit IIA [Aerococcus urinae]|uniref:PTS sugar transporter subunit IIA n=1 Tax=Aerococcus urinae TaxID=1376 RepID=UPI002550D2FA|nr:PTS sugar transporter subunit IIA [Aerococcus urinae]MDK6371093.1 PTS sugar transporter subunit IIA [Aerococcus urinae]